MRLAAVTRSILSGTLAALLWLGACTLVVTQWIAVSQDGEQSTRLVLGTLAVAAVVPIAAGIAVWTRRRNQLASVHRDQRAHDLPEAFVMTVEVLPALVDGIGVLRSRGQLAAWSGIRGSTLTLTVWDNAVALWVVAKLPGLVLRIPARNVVSCEATTVRLAGPVRFLPSTMINTVALTVAANGTTTVLQLSPRDLGGTGLRATPHQATVAASALAAKLHSTTPPPMDRWRG